MYVIRELSDTSSDEVCKTESLAWAQLITDLLRSAGYEGQFCLEEE